MFLEFSRTDVKTVTTCVIKGQLETLWTDEERISLVGVAIRQNKLFTNVIFLYKYQWSFWVIVKKAYIWLSIAEDKWESSINNGKLEIHGSFFREGEFVQTSDFSVCSLPLRDLIHVGREKNCREVSLHWTSPLSCAVAGSDQLRLPGRPPVLEVIPKAEH